jgi:hypothetical protein
MTGVTSKTDPSVPPVFAARARVPRTDTDRCPATLAQGCLRRSSYPGLRHVSCEHEGNVLVLRGHVSSYYLKQLAQELVRALAGGGRVVNMVEVATRQAS